MKAAEALVWYRSDGLVTAIKQERFTYFYLQITPSLHLPQKRLPDGATTDL